MASGGGGSTSKKHRTFVGEPMGKTKDVTELGPALGKRLADKGFDLAIYSLLSLLTYLLCSLLSPLRAGNPSGDKKCHAQCGFAFANPAA